MGLFDLLKRNRETEEVTRSALDEARDPSEGQGAITDLIQRILSVGLDGVGPVAGAKKVADEALKDNHGDREAAIDDLARKHIRLGASGGFVTSLGGFITMPVALPANVFEFYVLATRAVGAVATLRGYDISKPEIRTAVLLTLIGTKSDDILTKVGINTGANTVSSLASKNLPKAAIMMINKAVGFQLLKSLGERSLTRLGRLVPAAGGVIGALFDGTMMSRITKQAREEFPATV
ncbi:EcsC family protein [Nigerium massiliense]|uniref:EcsC family protein n=1 Tax=Nigerium massiliense TaxID=1522317 RepID=UPI000590A270|nr:EcsC family protein [Nigerium massiliense]